MSFSKLLSDLHCNTHWLPLPPIHSKHTHGKSFLFCHFYHGKGTAPTLPLTRSVSLSLKYTCQSTPGLSLYLQKKTLIIFLEYFTEVRRLWTVVVKQLPAPAKIGKVKKGFRPGQVNNV